MENNNKTVDKPPTFTDDKKRNWTIKLNVQLLDDVLAATEIDLVPEKDNVSALTGLLFDHRLLSRVLWVLCSDQAEAEGVDKKSFNQGLGAAAINDAWRAVVDSIVFFIHAKSPGMAQAVKELVEAEKRAVEYGTIEMLEALQTKEVDAALRQSAKKIGGQMKTEILAELGKCVTFSRE